MFAITSITKLGEGNREGGEGGTSTEIDRRTDTQREGEGRGTETERARERDEERKRRGFAVLLLLFFVCFLRCCFSF